MPDLSFSNEGLKRKIGAWGLSANLVNIIVGAGIFVLPAIVAEGLGPASILAYLLCGILLFLIMLCFAEAGSKVTTSGGAYAYIEAAFGQYPGFITSVLFLLSCITADAAVANALIGVLGTVHPLFQDHIYQLLFFVLIFGGLALVNIIGVQQGIGLVKILTVVKLLPLVLLVSLGWKEVEWDNFIWTETPDVHGLGQMALILFFAFQGAESGLAVSGEVYHPRKNVPKGIFIGLSAVLVLYVLIQYVSLGVLGATLVEHKEAPLAEVAHQVFGRWGLIIMTAVAAFSMFGNLSGEVLSMPRVLFGAAHDRVIPVKALAKVHGRFATPYVAIVVYALLGLGLAVFGGFRQLAVISGASILLVYLGVALSVLRLRKIHGSLVNTFRIPGGVLIPLASVVIIIWFLTNLELQETIGLMGFVLLLSLLYVLIRRFKNGQNAPTNLPTNNLPYSRKQ